MSKGLKALEKVEDFFIDYGSFDETGEYKNYISLYQTPEYQVIRKELKALEIISQNFKLVGNCLHARNPYAESGFVFVKELEDEEEHNAWKEVLL